PMKVLIQPAIDLAEKGFAISAREAQLLNAHKEKFEEMNTHRVVFVNDRPWKKGDILVQKNLAETLKRIQKNGRKEFYEGKTADLIVREMQDSNGIISKNDLKDYEVICRKPLVFDYK